jgi:hypothetical protein
VLDLLCRVLVFQLANYYDFVTVMIFASNVPNPTDRIGGDRDHDYQLQDH